MEVRLNPSALDIELEGNWMWNTSLPARRPFRETKLRIASQTERLPTSDDLLSLIADATVARGLLLRHPN